MALLDVLTLKFDTDFSQFDAAAQQAENRSKLAKTRIEDNLKFNPSSLAQELKRINDAKTTTRIQERQSVTRAGTVSNTRTVTTTNQNKLTNTMKEVVKGLDSNGLQSLRGQASVVSAINSMHNGIGGQLAAANQLQDKTAKAAVRQTTFGFRLQTALSNNFINQSIVPKLEKGFESFKKSTGKALKDKFDEIVIQSANALSRTGSVMMTGGDSFNETRLTSAMKKGAAEGAAQFASEIQESLLSVVGITTSGRSASNKFSDFDQSAASKVTAAARTNKDIQLLKNELGMEAEQLAEASAALKQFQDSADLDVARLVLESIDEELQTIEDAKENLKQQRRGTTNRTEQLNLTQELKDQDILTKLAEERREKKEAEVKQLEKEYKKLQNAEKKQQRVVKRYEKQIESLGKLAETQTNDIGELGEKGLLDARNQIVKKLREQKLTGAEIANTTPESIAQDTEAIVAKVLALQDVAKELDKKLEKNLDENAALNRKDEVVTEIRQLERNIARLEANPDAPRFIGEDGKDELELNREKLAELNDDLAGINALEGSQPERKRDILTASISRLQDEAGAIKSDIKAFNKELNRLRELELNRELFEELNVTNRALEDFRATVTPNLIKQVYDRLNIKTKGNSQLPKITTLSDEELDNFAGLNGIDQLDPKIYYDSINNQILTTQENIGVFQQDFNEASEDFVDSLLDALVRAKQTNFGKISTSDIDSGRQEAQKLIDTTKLTEDELLAASKYIETVKFSMSQEGIQAGVEKLVAKLRIKGSFKAEGELNDLRRGLDVYDAIIKSALEEKESTLKRFSEDNESVAGLEAAYSAAEDAQSELDSFISQQNALELLTPAQADKMVQQLTINLEDATNNLSTAFRAADDRQKEITKEKRQAVAAKATQALGDGVKFVGDAALETAGNAYKVASALEAATLAFIPFGQQVKSIAQIGVPAVGLGAAAIGSGVVDASLLPGQLIDAVQFANHLADPLATAISTPLGDMAGNIANAVTTSIGSNVVADIGANGGLGSGVISNTLSSVLPDISNSLSGATDIITTQITSVATKVAEFGFALTALTKLMRGGKGSNKSYFDNSDAIKTGEMVAGKVKGFTSNLRQSGSDEADNFADGFTTTLNQRYSDIFDASESGGDVAVKGFKSGIDSASPSKKTKQEGKNFIDGFILSIRGGLTTVFNRTKALGNQSVEGVKTALKDGKRAVANAASSLSNAIRFDVAPSLRFNTGASEAELDAGIKAISQDVGVPEMDLEVRIRPDVQQAQQEFNNEIDILLANADAAIASADLELIRRARIDLELGNNGQEFEDAIKAMATQLTEAEQNLRQVGQNVRTITNATISGASDRREANRDRVERGEISNAESLGESARAGVDAGVDAFRNSTSSIAQNIRDSMEVLKNGLTEGVTFVQDFARGFSNATTAAEKFKLSGIALAAGLFVAKDAIIAVVKNTFELEKRLDTVEKQLGNIGLGNVDIFERFGKAANQAGIDVLTFAESYAQMNASVRASIVDPEAFFGELTQGLNARGVSGEAASRSLIALTQIASKGVVSMEELRQQLGEALPGAMKISADAMGLTVAELNSMVASGQLASDDFLPKFAKELNNVSKNELPSLNSELARFNNLKTEATAAAGDNIPFASGLEKFNDVIEATMPLLKNIVTVTKVGIVGAGVVAVATLAKMALGIKAVAAASLLLGKSLLISGGAILGLALIATAFQAIKYNVDGAGKSIRDATRDLERLQAANARNGNSNTDFMGPDNSDPLANQNLRSGNFAQDTLDNLLSPFRKYRRGAINAIADVREDYNESIGKIADVSFELKAALSPESVERVRGEIEDLLAQRRNLTNQKDAALNLEKSEGEVLQLQKQIDDLTEEINSKVAFKFDTREAQSALLAVESILDGLRENQKITGADFSTEIMEAEKFRIELEKSLNIVKQLTNLGNVFKANQFALQDFEQASEIIKAKDAAEGQLEAYEAIGGEKARQRQFDMVDRKLAIDNLKAQLALQQERRKLQLAVVNSASSTTNEILAKNGIDNIEETSTLDLVAALNSLERQSSSSDIIAKGLAESIGVLTNAIAGRELDTEIVQTESELIKATVDLNEAVIDNSEQLRQLAAQRIGIQLEAAQFLQTLAQSGTGIQNERFTNSRFDTRDARASADEEIRSRKEAFTNLGRSMQDAARDITNNLREMTNTLRSSLAELGNKQLAGLNGFLDAAGLEDSLGLTKLFEPIKELASLNASSNIGNLQAEKAAADTEDERKQIDLAKEIASVNREADNSIRASQRRISDLQRELAQLSQQSGITELTLRQQQLSLRNNAISFNNQASELGVEQIPVPNIQIDFSDINAANSEIKRQIRQQIAIERDKIGQIDSTRQQGVASVQNESIDIDDAREERQRLFDAQIEAERRRLEVETANIELRLEGITEMIYRNAGTLANTIVNDVNGALKETNDLLNDVENNGRNITFFKDIETEAAANIDNQILKLQEQQLAYNTILDLLGQGEEADVRLDIEATINNADSLDEDIKAKLLSDIQAIKSSEELASITSEVAAANLHLADSEERLTEKREEAIETALDLARAEKQRELTSFVNQAKIKGLSVLDDGFDNTVEDRKIQGLIREIELAEELAKRKREINELDKDNPLLDVTTKDDLLAQAQEDYNKQLEKTKKEAQALKPILDEMSNGAVRAIKDGLLGIGDVLLGNSEKQKETNQLDKDYAERLSELVEMYGDNADELYKAKADLDEQRKDIEDDIDKELGTTARIFDFLKSILSNFAQSIADVAAKLAATEIAKGIAGIFGGGGGSGASGVIGALVGTTQTGYNGMEVANYMMGNEVGNYNNGGAVGLGLSVQAAMQREGAGAIPIVAHKGEQILTTKNKDAQFYRSIKRNGMWDEMKRNTKNYMYGGEVGGMSAIVGSAYNRHQQVMKSVNLNSNVTVIANNPSEFHRSKDQINRSQAAQMDNLSRRGLAR